MTNTNSLKGPAGPPQATARVLVVDDLADARWILTNLLRIEGLEYSEAASGGAALHSIRQNAPDLVLLDVGLPDMDGFEVLARIKALDKAIPVVMITANGNTLAGPIAFTSSDTTSLTVTGDGSTTGVSVVTCDVIGVAGATPILTATFTNADGTTTSVGTNNPFTVTIAAAAVDDAVAVNGV